MSGKTLREDIELWARRIPEGDRRLEKPCDLCFLENEAIGRVDPDQMREPDRAEWAVYWTIPQDNGIALDLCQQHLEHVCGDTMTVGSKAVAFTGEL